MVALFQELGETLMDAHPIAKTAETRRFEERVHVRYKVIHSDPTCGFKRLAVFWPDIAPSSAVASMTCVVQDVFSPSSVKSA